MTKKPTEFGKKEEGKSLTEEQQFELIREEIQRLISLSKTRGALTVEEVNEELAAEIVAPAVLDHLMHSFEVHGVIITDHTENKTEGEEDSANFLADPEKDQGEEEEETMDEEALKGNDPVQIGRAHV
mgnify:CR=1 FL=1